MKKAERLTTPTLSRRQWFEDGVALETEPPMSPSSWPTIVRHTSADRQRQYADAGQPLAVIDELIACRDQRTTAMDLTVPVPRWAIDAAIRELVLHVTLDRRPGRNASLSGKAIMESTHRLRYDVVQWAEREGFVGKFKWQAALALYGDPNLKVTTIRQSHARIVKDPSFGQLSARYVAASSGPRSDMKRREEATTLKDALNKIGKKQLAWQSAKEQEQKPSVIARKRAASER